MNNALSQHNPVKHAKSFKYAFHGLFFALLNEANFRVQVVFAVIVTVLGFYFGITNAEWGLLILAMGFLLSAELVNTVVEEFMDKLIPEESDVVKVIKDLSAGFVFIAAATAFLIFLLVFAEKLFH